MLKWEISTLAHKNCGRYSLFSEYNAVAKISYGWNFIYALQGSSLKRILVDKYADWSSGCQAGDPSLACGPSVANTPGLRGGSKGKGKKRGTRFEQGQEQGKLGDRFSQY